MTPIDIEKCALNREFIHERMGWIIIQAEIAQRYCALGDDQGLAYETKRIVDELRLALESMKDIEIISIKAREAA
jgi:hypothetical protein